MVLLTYYFLNDRQVPALEHNGIPVMPANVYLDYKLHCTNLRNNSLASHAYILLELFRFLDQIQVDFWTLSVPHLDLFKQSLIRRTKTEEMNSLNPYTVKLYLRQTSNFLRYWLPHFSTNPLLQAQIKDKDFWSFAIPQRQRRSSAEYHGLSDQQVRLVTDYLCSCLQNKSPDDETQTLLSYRNLAIWGLFHMTGARIGEFVRIRVVDLDFNKSKVSLVEREEDAWLGEFKTGPAEIPIPSHHPYWRYLNDWLTHGRYLAEERWLKYHPFDHGLLFCNQDGGPLTKAAIYHLLDQIETACGFPKGLMHAHITRHTFATMLLNAGVPLEIVQRLLRHTSIKSTEVYSKHLPETIRSIIEGINLPYA